MKPTKKQVKQSIEHLVYEIMMFHGVSYKLLSGVSDQFEKNVLLESFAIHNRNLFDLFYKKRKFKTDMIASDFNLKKKDFLSERTHKRVLENLTRKTDKQIVHLTYSRLNYNRSNKGWDINKIYSDMNKTIAAFYKCLGSDEKQWILEFYGKYGLNAQNLRD